MTELQAKEYAEELFDSFYLIPDERGICRMNEYIAKQCALLSLEMSIKEINKFNRHGGFQHRIDSLKKVKQEIEKL